MEEEKNIEKKKITNDSNVIEEKSAEESKEIVEEKESKPRHKEENKHENQKEKHLKKESKKEKKDKDEKNKDKESKFKKIEDNKKAKFEFEKMQDQKEQTINKRKKRKRAIIISLILVILIAIFSTIFAFININNEKIISGVTIKGIEVSGLTKEEAMAKLETIYSEKLEKDLKLKYGEYESELNPTLMEVKYDIEKAVNEACLLGKDGNIFINNYKILSTLIQKKDINVNMTLNEEVTKQTINDMGQNLPGIMLESSYTIEGNKLIITKGKDGIVIDTDTLLNKVKKQIDIKHKELCTVRGIVFDTIEEAEIYRDEIDRFEKIYMEGNSYADYESSKLRKVVELLKKESFKNAKILDAEKQLERRVEILTQHEKSEEYKKGKNLLTEFQDVSIDNLYIYGTQNYLPEAYKVRKNNKIRKYEENCFPIIIYDESQSSNIKGIVVSEKFIYDFNAMLGLNMKAIALDAIAELSANVQKSTIEIRMSTAEKYRLKVSSNLHVDVLVSKLIRALNLKENFENRRNQSQETIQNSISRENIKTEENNLKTTEDSTNIKVTQGDCSQPTQIHDDVVKKSRWWYSAPIILILSFLGVAMFPLEIVAIALLIIRLTKGDSSTVVAKIINIIVCVLTVLFCLICFV